MSKLLGSTPCWNPKCNVQDVGVYQTPGGVLIGKCHRCQCEFSGRLGTKANRDINGVMIPDLDLPPSPVKAVALAVAEVVTTIPKKKATCLLDED
jgi:hypothetical protein